MYIHFTFPLYSLTRLHFKTRKYIIGVVYNSSLGKLSIIIVLIIIVEMWIDNKLSSNLFETYTIHKKHFTRIGLTYTCLYFENNKHIPSGF